MVKLYTKTGDKGETSLRTGERIRKSDARVEAYGTIDELNCAIAVAIIEVDSRQSTVDSRNVKQELRNVQSDLFHIGAILAGETKGKEKRLNLLEGRVSELESQIDELQKELPQQTAFYLPGGSKQAAYLDLARSVCRRAERRIVALAQRDRDREAVKYLNRLSDYLYALARWVNDKIGVEEREWKSGL